MEYKEINKYKTNKRRRNRTQKNRRANERLLWLLKSSLHDMRHETDDYLPDRLELEVTF